MTLNKSLSSFLLAWHCVLCLPIAFILTVNLLTFYKSEKVYGQLRLPFSVFFKTYLVAWFLDDWLSLIARCESARADKNLFICLALELPWSLESLFSVSLRSNLRIRSRANKWSRQSCALEENDEKCKLTERSHRDL